MLLLLLLFLTAKEACSGEREGERRRKRGMERRGRREGGKEETEGERERDSFLQHMTHVVLQ